MEGNVLTSAGAATSLAMAISRPSEETVSRRLRRVLFVRVDLLLG